MNLCIDIGNSFIKLAVLSKKNEILHKEVIEKLYVSTLNKLKSKFNLQNVIVGASGRLPRKVIHHLDRNYHLIILDDQTKVPVYIDYETPETLGRDRLAGAIGAHATYKKKDNCIIDIGTCITYDVITKEGVFKGGNIAPGVELRLRSMNDYTTNLPLVSRGNLNGFIGKSTKEALQNGATLGTLLEIESFIERIRKKFLGINIILTGGDANFFADKINSKIFVNPHLVLIGLNEILNFNVN